MRITKGGEYTRLVSNAASVPAGGVTEGGTTTALDAILAASSGQDIADALTGAGSPSAGNVFATLADAGGGSGIPFIARQGGNATDWSVGGSTGYNPATPNMQAGVTAAQTTGAGPITVTFPTAYANPPIVVASIGDATVNGNGLGVMVTNVTATTFDCYPWSTPAQGSATGKVHWIAIGI